MCDLCVVNESTKALTSRRRLWELSKGWHCSIIGTCLKLSDLRNLARKLKVQTVETIQCSVDYQLHSLFVKESSEANIVAKMINKLLDKRHSSTIRKVRAMNTEVELHEFWVGALSSGDIPGPYWSILSHPNSTIELAERMFADIHMLSHMVGASNRADIQKLQMVEESVAKIEERVSRQQRQHIKNLAARDATINALRSQLQQTQLRSLTTAEKEHSEPCNCALIPKLNDNILQLSTKISVKNSTIDQSQDRVRYLEALVVDLQDENTSLELACARSDQFTDEVSSLNLNGQCLLYVGGRQNTVCRLRNLVEDLNGKFIHHDGGVERSMKELASAVTRADAVVFPVDCISHGAANKVKRLCQQSLKPFITLRTSGIGSLVAGLKKGLLSLPIH
jgi:hypothetical protein